MNREETERCSGCIEKDAEIEQLRLALIYASEMCSERSAIQSYCKKAVEWAKGK